MKRILNGSYACALLFVFGIFLYVSQTAATDKPLFGPGELDLSICKQNARLTASDVLILAVNNNDKKLLDCVLKKKPALADYRSCSNQHTNCETRPHVAREFKRFELVDAVIDGSTKERLAATSALGNMATALLFSEKGQASWFTKLKAKGVRFDVANKYGNTAQMLACRGSDDDVAKILGVDALTGPVKVGQVVYALGSIEGKVHRVCSDGAVIVTADGRKFYKFDILKTAKYQRKATKSSTTPKSDFVPHATRICLTYDNAGALVCTPANAKTVTCPGDKNWRGPGPCSKYRGKKVADLRGKEWKDLKWVYDYEIEKRNAPPVKPGETKVERCIGKCAEKKCRRESPGTYQESWTSASRCGYFCKGECETNPDAYR